LADDDKTYPGAMCRLITALDAPTNATPPLTLADVMNRMNATAVTIKQENGAMLNWGPGPQTWICPVVREWMEKQPEYARITVQENGIEPVN